MTENLCQNCFCHLDGAGGHPQCGCTELRRHSSALPLGTLLNGNFRVGRLLGEPGGFGVAYLCKDIALDTTVAIKELFPQDAVQRSPGSLGVVNFPQKQREFEIQRDAFLSEARTLAKIKHPAVVNIRHYFSENNTAYIVMDYYPGRSLAQVVEEMKRLPHEVTVDLLWPVLSGLREVHSHGILHRDIKPENVFITDSGRAVLLDFGNAKSSDGKDGNKFIGVSPFFAPPEQYANKTEYMGAWTDIYSICALVYYCLTGARPADSRQRQADPGLLQPIAGFGVAVPDILTSVLSQGMELRYNKRFQSVEQLQLALKPLRPQIGQFIWTEALASGGFSVRMRAVAEAVRAGKGVPWQFSPAATFLQCFWFLGHRMMRWGALSGLVAAAALTLLAYDRELWPVTLLLMILNGVGSGLFGMSALYYHIDSWSKEQPTRTPTEVADATKALQTFGRMDYLMAARGLAVPVVFLLAFFARTSFDGSVRDQITLAIQLEQLRGKVNEYYAQHGGPPDSMETLGFQFVPNSEVRALRLYGTSVEVTFELPEVRGKKVILKLKSAGPGKSGWNCSNVDVPERYLPGSCQAE